MWPTPPDGTVAWWYYTAFSLAVIVIGIGKSGFGGGIGILSVPLIASAVPAQHAMGFLLPILIAADVFAVWLHRKHVSWRMLRDPLLGAAGGIVLGTLLIWLFKERGELNAALQLCVGVICLLLVALQCYRLTGAPLPRLPHNPGTGVSAGGLSGVVSTLAHAAGPIMSVYWLEQRPDKRTLVGSLAWFFFITNCVKLPTYTLLPINNGRTLINLHTLTENLVFVILVPIGSLLGIWMHHRIPEKPFTVVMYLGAAAAAIHLIHKALM